MFKFVVFACLGVTIANGFAIVGKENGHLAVDPPQPPEIPFPPPPIPPLEEEKNPPLGSDQKPDGPNSDDSPVVPEIPKNPVLQESPKLGNSDSKLTNDFSLSAIFSRLAKFYEAPEAQGYL